MNTQTATGRLKYAPDGYLKLNEDNAATWKACVCGSECSRERGSCGTSVNPAFIRFLRNDPVQRPQ